MRPGRIMFGAMKALARQEILEDLEIIPWHYGGVLERLQVRYQGQYVMDIVRISGRPSPVVLHTPWVPGGVRLTSPRHAADSVNHTLERYKEERT